MNKFNEMDIENHEDSIQDFLLKFKGKYSSLKIELYHFCDCLHIFDHEFHISRNEVKSYLTISNIMELCRIIHDYFLCRDISILSSATHILEKIVVTDDSPKDEVDMYISAYLLITIESEPHKHEELFNLIVDVSQYYEMYLKGYEKMIFDMISLEETFEDFSL